MYSPLILALALIVGAYGSGEFVVLTHPPSISFKGHDHLKESLLKEVYSAALGFTTEQDSNWQGMFLLEPFNLAKAIVTVVVDGVTDVGAVKGHSFPLKTDEDESDTYDTMVRRVEERQPGGGNNFVRVELNEGLYGILGMSVFKGIKNVKPQKPESGSLKLSVEEDRAFLEELTLFNAIIDKISQGGIGADHFPDIFWFKMTSLHALSDLHGENATATKEAKRLLAEALDRLDGAFRRAYDGKVLVNVVTSDTSHTRRMKREAGDAVKIDYDTINLAKTYDPDYPVIFNIILWFGVTMVFALLAISYFIGNMDPGRDSIIYRMTSTRMKKDN